ncbi:mandelate racemase/muconate lactonizing enzyme family protein [Myxococcaceae bacterium GXIMD 01537]
MRITDVSLTALRIELARPLKTARASYTAREGFVVRLTDEEGHVGLGEAMPLEEFGTESAATSERVLRFLLDAVRGRSIGDDLDDVEEAVYALMQEEASAQPDDAGHTPAASHALEQALLDLAAQRQGLPLNQLLSGGARQELDVSALLREESPEALAEEARRAVEAGYETLKLKVATGPLDADEARVKAIREAVGPAVKLRIDANGGWSDTEAARALDRLGWYGLELCEQPVPPAELQNLWRLQRRAPCPLAVDESLASPELLPTLLGDTPVAHVFVLKPMVLGGLLPALGIARRGAAMGVESYVTSSIDGVVARAGAAHLAAALPSGKYASGLSVGSLYTNEPAEHPFQPSRGRIRLPAAPGLGLRV